MKQPNAQQLDALTAWFCRHGRTWKSKLRHAWETGQYDDFDQSNYLQQVRNEFGPSWLVRFRFLRPPNPNGTITREELAKLAYVNSPDIPKAVVVLKPRRMEWVGIGWIDCGEPRGDEVEVAS